MNFKKLITTGIMALAALATFATPTVTDVVAKQRYPWNGLVDITCKVTGIEGTTNGLKFAVAAVDIDSGTTNKVAHFWVVQDGTNSTDYAVHTNGDYRIVWDAQADFGEVRCSNMVVRVALENEEAHQKVQLWENGPYWATTNIGADEPWERGYYFWWGDTVGYKRENNVWVASDGSSSNFSFNDGNAHTCNKEIDMLKSEGWITADNTLVPEHDAAFKKWGGGWRMPTNQELVDLCDKCDWFWTTSNDVYGYIIKGKGDYSSASIFLPAAGFADGTVFNHYNSSGYYWSSVPYSSNKEAWYLGFLYIVSNSYVSHNLNYKDRSEGLPIRPVQGFADPAAEVVRAGESTPFLLDTVTCAACGNDLYCVIDLTGGPNATAYPVSYLSEVPSGGWTDEYKTSKLVLRKIPAGSFMMGGTVETTISKPFYIGVFEVTQRQWELVMRTRPSYFNNTTYYATRPVEQISYTMIRGSANGTQWPESAAVDSDSFLGIIQARTGLDLDLPTEAQWEYACHAGTTTDYNNGENRTGEVNDENLNEIGRNRSNGGCDNGAIPSRNCNAEKGTAVVGSYLPNTWELYDMHGNVCEWCRDRYGDTLAGGVDPSGHTSNQVRVYRGGSFVSSVGIGEYTSFYRVNYYFQPADSGAAVGFRLCCSSTPLIAYALGDGNNPIPQGMTINSYDGSVVTEGAHDGVAMFSHEYSNDSSFSRAPTNVFLSCSMTGPQRFSFDWGGSFESEAGGYIFVFVDGAMCWSKGIDFSNDFGGTEEIVVGDGFHTIEWALKAWGAPVGINDFGSICLWIDGIKLVELEEMQYEISGYNGAYDGNGHGIAVRVMEPNSGYAIKYSVGDEVPTPLWSSEPPAMTNVGSMTVWCEISAPGYMTQTNSATIRITQATNEWFAAPSMMGWICGQTPSEPNMGEAKFGEASVTYSGAGGALGTARPTDPGEYVAVFTVTETANWSGLSTEVPFKITAAEEAKLEDAFEGLPVTLESDGEGGWIVTITNDATAIRIPDNLGKVTLDLNGFNITGTNGFVNVDGGTAIEIYASGLIGDATHLKLVDSRPDEDADVVGGTGGEKGEKPADIDVWRWSYYVFSGGYAILVGNDVLQDVRISIGPQVKVVGGDGYNDPNAESHGGHNVGTDGGNGAIGVKGFVESNEGVIVGGNGGSGGIIWGRNGVGGAGVAGGVERNVGTICGGNGGNGRGVDPGDDGGNGGDGVVGYVRNNEGGIFGGDGGMGYDYDSGNIQGGTGGAGISGKVEVNSGLIRGGVAGGAYGNYGPYFGGDAGVGVFGDVWIDVGMLEGGVSGVIGNRCESIGVDLTGDELLEAALHNENVTNLVYDGLAHGLLVPSYSQLQSSVKYSLNRTGPYDSISPQFSAATNVVIWYVHSSSIYSPSVTNAAMLSISGRAISLGMVTPIPAQEYTGAATEPHPEVRDVACDVLLVEGWDYTLSYTNNVSVGTATVIVNGRGNYTGRSEKTFTIIPKGLTVAMVGAVDNEIYNGSAFKPEPTVVDSERGVTLAKGTDYTLSWGANTAAGSGSVTVTGKGNYTGSVTKNFTIARRDIADAVVTLGGGLTYNGQAQAQSISSVKAGGLTVTYTVSGNTATDPGTYTLTVTGTGNFTGTTTKQFSIARKSVAGATVTLGGGLTYTGTAQSQGVSAVTIGGLNATFDVSGNSATAAGTYTLTVTGTGKFTGSTTKQFTVSPKALTAAMVGTVGNVTYTGSAHKPEPTVTDSERGVSLVKGTDYAFSYANNVNVGTATVTVTGKGNYTGAIQKTFMIGKQMVTPPVIPAKRYTGEPQTADVPASDLYRVIQNIPQTNPGNYPVMLELCDGANYRWPDTDSTFYTVPFSIKSSSETTLEDVLEGLPVTLESDGEGGWIVTITNDIDAADLPIEIPDNLGPVTIDLNGHDLVGEDGQPAILIVPGEGDGEPTVITIVNSGDDAIVQGGEGAPAIEVDDGAQDGVLINIGEGVTVQGGGDDVPAIIGEVGVNEGTIVGPSRIHIPGEGTVVVPKSWKVGQKVTWKATAAKGSVFARWEGAFVDLLNLTKNERRNPSLAFVVPVGFETNGISAVFISVDDDRLGTLALSRPGPLAPNADVAGLSLVDDSESYVTASVSGLPAGLKFDAKTLAITGKPTKPGIYTVKVTAKNASGYQWAENIALRVADIENARIDFGGLPETGAVGEPFAGRIAAGEFKSLSASGWPSGVKFDAKTGSVAGIPTKGGWFTVTVTATYADKSKATATRLLTISPAAIAEPKRTAYHPLTVVPANAAGGTTTGTGVYAEGKKVSISAKPAKGYVFAGWYRDPDLTEPMAFAADDWRKASQSVVVPEVRYLFARFVTEREDGNNIALAVDGVEMASGAGHQPYQTNVMCGVYMEWPVAVETLSLPTVAVAGLPTGLKFTAKDVVDSKTKQVTVPACTIYGTPTAASKVDAKTGAVKPSVVNVTVTTASKAKVVYEIDVTVDAMPEWAVGTFDGYVRGSGTLAASGEEDSGEGSDMGVAFPKGLATVTVAANGKISGKLQEGDKTWTLSAANFDAYDAGVGIYTATVVGKSGKEVVTNEVTVAAEEMRLGEDASPHLVGVVSGATVGRAVLGEPYSWTAWQNLWKTEPWKTDAKPFAKAPALAIDAGTRDACPYPGTITLKFASSGSVTASGKFVTGQDAKGKDVVYSASCSSVLVPEGDAAGAGRPPYRVFLYFPPKTGKFEGYADEIQLVWDGAAFEAVRP